MIARRGSRLVFVAAVIVAALAIGWLAVRTTMPRALAAQPEAAQRFAPRDPDALFRIATMQYATNQNTPPRAATPAMIADAAAGVPLSSDPFTFAAIRALAERDYGRATRLLEAARHRNPRNRLARALLVERYVRARDAEAAGVELATLNRLVPDARKLLTQSMAALASDPATSMAVARALQNDPALDGLLSVLVQQGVAADQILTLARYRRVVADAPAPAWQGELVARLVREGRYAQARALWGRLAGVAPTAQGAPYNPNFEERSAPAPFNWQLVSSALGVAEPRRRGGLSVEFFGRDSGLLASQLLMLSPGRYRLGFIGDGNAKGTSSRLIWHVRCAAKGRAIDGGRMLLSAVVANVSGTPRRLQAAFTVPANCPAQWLTLDGIATEFPDNQFVEISQLALTRIGAPR